MQFYKPDPGPASGEPLTLSSHHRRMLLDESGISPEVAAERGYYTARRRSEVPEAFPNYQRRLGLVVPICSPDGRTRSAQLRPDNPRKDRKGKPRKYETPGNSRVVLDVHPRMLEEVRSGTGDLWITEGVKKADALTSRGCQRWRSPACGCGASRRLSRTTSSRASITSG